MLTKLTLFILCLMLPLVADAADPTIQSATIQVNPVGSDSDREWLSILWTQPLVDFDLNDWRITLNGHTQKLFSDERWSSPCYNGQSQHWIIVDNFDLAQTMIIDEQTPNRLCWLRTKLTLSNQLDTLNQFELSQLAPKRLDWLIEWQNVDWSERGYPIFWTAESWRYLPFLDQIDIGQANPADQLLELTELLIDPPGADTDQEGLKVHSLAKEPIQLADYYIRIEDKLERLPNQLLEPGQTIAIKLQRLTLPNRNFEVALLRPTSEPRQTLVDLWQKQKRPVLFESQYSGWYRLTEAQYQPIPAPSSSLSIADATIGQSSAPLTPITETSRGLKPSAAKSSARVSAEASAKPQSHSMLANSEQSSSQSLSSIAQAETPVSSAKISQPSPSPSPSLKPKLKLKPKAKAKAKTNSNSFKPRVSELQPSPTVLIKSRRQSLPNTKREQQVKLLFLNLLLIYLAGLALFRVWQHYQKQPKL